MLQKKASISVLHEVALRIKNVADTVDKLQDLNKIKRFKRITKKQANANIKNALFVKAQLLNCKRC